MPLDACICGAMWVIHCSTGADDALPAGYGFATIGSQLGALLAGQPDFSWEDDAAKAG